MFLALVFAACIKEDLEICLPQSVRISFSFIPSAACAEEVVTPTDVNRLIIFLFDENGLFVQEVDTVPTGTNYQIEVSLVPAHYQFVAVAGYNNDQLRGVPFIPGATHIQDAAVATYLEQRNGTLLSADHVLYLGSDTLTVLPETPGQELAMTLIQRTKTLNITVDGIATTVYQIALAGNAAQYTFEDEQVYLTGSPMVYVPIQQSEDGMYSGRTLVNWPLKDNGDYTRFQIINPVTGMRLVDEDFSLLLLSVPELDLECASSFDIDILYTASLRLVIYINNWKVYDEGYELI